MLGLVFSCQSLPKSPRPANEKIDFLLVSKSKRTLTLFSENQALRTFKISLGEDPILPKEKEGDKRTPEGLYKIITKSSTSDYYKNLGISYPNAKDIERTKKQNINPGGDIKIHGLKNGYSFWGRLHRFLDWTNGCIAVTNSEIDELYHLVPLQTPIQIVP